MRNVRTAGGIGENEPASRLAFESYVRAKSESVSKTIRPGEVARSLVA